MRTIRTQLRQAFRNDFRDFLDKNEMNSVLIGDYLENSALHYGSYLCYAYSEQDEACVASMTYLSIKYGNIEKAFLELT